MKYFSLASLAILGFVAAAPAHKPENEFGFVDYADNSDCYEDEVVEQVQPAFNAVDDIAPFENVDDLDCESDPIPEDELIDIVINKPAFEEEDNIIQFVEKFAVEQEIDPSIDEECEVDPITTTQAPVVVSESEPPCYSDEDFNNAEEPFQQFPVNYDPINPLDFDNAYADIDQILFENGNIAVEAENEGFEDCLEY